MIFQGGGGGSGPPAPPPLDPHLCLQRSSADDKWPLARKDLRVKGHSLEFHP